MCREKALQTKFRAELQALCRELEAIEADGDTPALEVDAVAANATDIPPVNGELEGAMRELVDSNRLLRAENSEAREGIRKALGLIRSLQTEKLAREKRIQQCRMNLTDNTRAFWSVDIPHVDANMDPKQFYRDFVCANRPCIISHDRSRARSLEWIQSQCEESVVSVNCTPNGLADAVVDDVFVKPHAEKVLFSTFMERLRAKNDEDVVYVSEQNDSLRREFPQLYQDPPMGSFEEHHLDAVNFWLGDERSYTSFHKDHYENFYTVLSGTKIFWLVPPSSASCVYEKPYPSAIWRGGPGKWILEAEPESVPWIPVDARSWETSSEYRQHFPDFDDAGMRRIEIEEGESLYLPSLWYHAASQLGIMAAINYWFDMQFDCKWVYYQYLREMNDLP